jgi:hypothetical protein
MTIRPTSSPAFATAATFTGGALSGSPPRLDPGSGLKAQGFYPSRAVPARWFNFLLGVVGDWLQYVTQKTDYIRSVDQFGALPGNSAAVNTPLIQAAISDCSASGGGTVRFGIGSYKHTGLTWPNGVRLEGVPGFSALNLDHPTNQAITLSAGGDGELVMYGLDLEGEQINAADAIRDPGGVTVNVTMQHCRINKVSTMLAGRLLSIGSTNSRFTLIDCDLRSSTSSQSAIDGGHIVIRGGKYTMAPGATVSMVKVDTLDHEGATFTQVKTGSTAAAFIESALTGGHIRSRGGLFDVDDGSAGASGYAFKLVATAYLDVSGYTLGSNCGSFLFVSGPLNSRSRLELLPSLTQVVPGLTTTIPTGYAAWTGKFTGGSSPTVTLPQILFAGQTLDLTIYAFGATWGFSLAGYGLKATQPTVNAATAATARFIAGDPSGSGSLSWTQVGGWGSATP